MCRTSDVPALRTSQPRQAFDTNRLAPRCACVPRPNSKSRTAAQPNDGLKLPTVQSKSTNMMSCLLWRLLTGFFGSFWVSSERVIVGRKDPRQAGIPHTKSQASMVPWFDYSKIDKGGSAPNLPPVVKIGGPKIDGVPVDVPFNQPLTRRRHLAKRLDDWDPAGSALVMMPSSRMSSRTSKRRDVGRGRDGWIGGTGFLLLERNRQGMRHGMTHPTGGFLSGNPQVHSLIPY